MQTLYYYKLTVDDGGAPCIRNGLLSLAICKPMIRAKAELDSIIFGFAANSLEETNPLLYIAVVTDIARDGAITEIDTSSHARTASMLCGMEVLNGALGRVITDRLTSFTTWGRARATVVLRSS